MLIYDFGTELTVRYLEQVQILKIHTDRQGAQRVLRCAEEISPYLLVSQLLLIPLLPVDAAARFRSSEDVDLFISS